MKATAQYYPVAAEKSTSFVTRGPLRKSHGRLPQDDVADIRRAGLRVSPTTALTWIPEFHALRLVDLLDFGRRLGLQRKFR